MNHSASPAARPVLLVTELFPPAVGGSAVLYENVYGRIRDTEIQVLTDPRTSDLPAGAQGPFRVHHGRLRSAEWGVTRPAGLLHHWRAASRILELSRAGGACVHTGRALPEGVAAWFARRRGGAPYLCWAHGEDLATAETSRELTWVMRRVYGAATAVLANSHNTARSLDRVGVGPERILVAHPGVDSGRFRPDVDGSAVRERHARPNDIVLLSVGRLQRRKGHDRVIEAMGQLARSDLRFLIAGTGEEEDRLRRLAADAGVAHQVTFLGKVLDEELPAHYAACDVFLMPNRQEGADIEGFGIVFLEAQATARPVIAGRTGGAPEAVAEGETALLVGGDDVGELAGAIGRLADSPDLRQRMGAAGRCRAAEDFTWDRTAAVAREAHHRLELAR